jgi:hypothetical protein
LYDLELIRKVCTKINEAESQREHNALDALLEAVAKNDEAEVRIVRVASPKGIATLTKSLTVQLEAAAFASAVLLLSERMQ